MKKNYLRNTKPGPAGRLWALLALLWFVPLLGHAQTFTESMGTMATEGQSVASYDNLLGFDNDNEKGLGYASSGANTPVLSLGGPNGGSGGANILFSDNTGGGNFFIRDISTAGFSSATFTFQLNAPAGQITTTSATVNNRFRVAYSVGTVNPNASASYSSYTNLPYAYSAGSAGGWATATVILPADILGNPLVAFRFTRVSAATGDFRIDDVQLGGTAASVVTGLPTTSLDFGDMQVGANSAVQNILVSGQQLMGGTLTVTVPAGYQVRAGGSYTQSLALPVNNGVVPSTKVQVRFAPTVAGPNNGSLVVASAGASSVTIALTGNGTVPTLAVMPTAINFGTTFVGQVTAPTNFTVSGTAVTNNVTVTAPANFSVRRTISDAYAQSVILTAAEVNAGFTLQARFSPVTAGTYNSNIQISTPNAVNTTVAVQGQANPTPAGPFIVVNPTALDFGTVTSSGSSQTLSFSVNAGNLTGPLTITRSNDKIKFREATAGGGLINGPIVIYPTGGSVSIRTIEVQLVGLQTPLPQGIFSGNITVSSPGATSSVVTITANNSTGTNSTINASGNLTTFSTVPGEPSATQTYTLSGTNLLQGITVSAPTYFQVSLDPSFPGLMGATGNSFLVPRNSGNDVLATTVYVRFLPASALSTTSSIGNSSSPALAQTLPVDGTSEPAIQVDNAFQAVTKVVIDTTSAGQTLNITAKRVKSPITISKALTPNPSNPGNTPQFELSLDGISYGNTVTLIPDPVTFTVNQPIYARYAPTYLGSATSTLSYQSTDFPIASAQEFGFNKSLAGSSIDVEPTKRSTPTIIRSGATATVNFNLPANYAASGYGEGRVIVASENPTLPAASQPQDGNSYLTGNQNYGLGPEVDTGYFIVYKGDNNFVLVDGLTPSKTYYFYTFEYNNIDNNSPMVSAVNGAENYLSPPVPNLIPGIEAPGNPLPVTLVSFTAKPSGAQVGIRWETASETNNKQFEVERSRDSRTFETILTRAGKGTTNATTVYNEVDRRPLNGLSYYRLKQVDLDGKTSYSSIISVSFLKAGEVKMYPNPVTDQLTITMDGGTEGVTATITDLAGRTVQTQQLRADGKLSTTNLKVGTYLVTVGNGKAVATRRIVKQ
ncbi:T9SS type A sorting domain-containing protein [Hymenobacter aerophilus]|uniref:T9SS type A sorting domain-containing protein n=1 Tax=Hymenobacter aerophilus TaxID=119644 RepID=UPI001469D085|nr:T9SS type A sorting domain-containing protein [Hymenobacter aerophilus]